MADDNKLPSILPTLMPHTGQAEGAQPAEQGPPPADFGNRPASAVSLPTGEHLNAEQVAQMVGSDQTATDTNVALDNAEGVDSTSDEN